VPVYFVALSTWIVVNCSLLLGDHVVVLIEVIVRVDEHDAALVTERPVRLAPLMLTLPVFMVRQFAPFTPGSFMDLLSAAPYFVDDKVIVPPDLAILSVLPAKFLVHDVAEEPPVIICPNAYSIPA